MRYTDYSDIIFEGLEYHKQYFEPYITRCLKNAEKDFITNNEFLSRLADVMRHYETELLKFQMTKIVDFNNNLTIENFQNTTNDGLPNMENTYIEIGNYTTIYKGQFGFNEISLIRETILNIAQELMINIDVEQTTIPETLIRFDNAAQKYILLKELGVIDFLNEQYPLNSSAKKGLLLAYITDTKTGKPFENILSAVFNKNSESDHYPYKEKNEIKVNRILAEIGIEKKTIIAAIKKK
jgi:hypothetical protein